MLFTMPTVFDIQNTITSDTDACVSIGLGTAGRHLSRSNGVAIGQSIYGVSNTSDLNLGSGVLIGTDIFPIVAVDGLATDTVAIGRSIATSAYTSEVKDSVLIDAN